MADGCIKTLLVRSLLHVVCSNLSTLSSSVIGGDVVVAEFRYRPCCLENTRTRCIRLLLLIPSGVPRHLRKGGAVRHLAMLMLMTTFHIFNLTVAKCLFQLLSVQNHHWFPTGRLQLSRKSRSVNCAPGMWMAFQEHQTVAKGR